MTFSVILRVAPRRRRLRHQPDLRGQRDQSLSDRATVYISVSHQSLLYGMEDHVLPIVHVEAVKHYRS